MGLTLYRRRLRLTGTRGLARLVLTAASALAAASSIPPAAAQAAGVWDSRSATIEALALLKSLLRGGTNHAEGEGLRAARILAVFFGEKGIGCELLERSPGTGSLICKVKGKGEAPPLLVVTRLDAETVPEGASTETHGEAASEEAGEAGSGETGAIRDGRICGGGVLTGQGMAAAAAEGMALLGRRRPPRDIILVGIAEGGFKGGSGLQWLLESRPELLDAGMALTGQGGRLVEAAGKLTEVSVEFDEKTAPVPQSVLQAIARVAPEAKVAAHPGPPPPESQLLRQRGVLTYGLLPFPLKRQSGGLGADVERCLSLESFEVGVRLMMELLREASAG